MKHHATAEPFLKRWWRPAMALQYLIVCIFDFVIFPGSRELTFTGGGAFHEWRSLTLQGGGLYHAAMGAICGVYAWQKTKELMAQMGGGSVVERERVTERSVSVGSGTTDTPPSDQQAQQSQQPAQSGRAD